ncbi:MAG: DUF1499 domain-containing protein [Pseudomonadota bacterium]
MAIVVVLLLAAVAVLVAARLGAFSGRLPDNLGLRDGRLKPPSKTPNSVSSQAGLWADHPQREGAQIAALQVQGGGPATLERLARVIESMDGARIVERRSDYIYAQFTTKLMRFVDDAEFWFDPVAGVIQVRSASRVGRKDFGVNRARVEAIRARMAGT